MNKNVLKMGLLTLLCPPLGLAVMVKQSTLDEAVIESQKLALHRNNELYDIATKDHMKSMNELKSLLESAWEREEKLKKENKKLKTENQKLKSKK